MVTIQATTANVSRLELLQQRLGRVNHQPVSVHSFTNKRFTVNYRAPLDQVRRLLPPGIEPDEIPGTGLGMFGMCACDFWVTRFGWMPVPKIRNNDMLLRVSARIPKNGVEQRAFYTISSNSSSPLLGFLGTRYSHFRKRVSTFSRLDDGEIYQLRCTDPEPLAQGVFTAQMKSISKERPESSLFSGIESATEFLFNLDGSCGYSFTRKMLSFQKIDYPEWDMYFCHDAEFDFPLLTHLMDSFHIEAELDCILFMKDTPQTWGSSWLYTNDAAGGWQGQ
ncbi:hypothetical protein [Planctomicrobium piriforme]|uniref:Uncharacterized protein n=1 Tax=Planctomicrobium piriforme TaxID=1576369 RepID=A0A1I3PCS2_9PLAN|nr:hypothetical protein [Planctomicrobium piriforme]SFJ19273.1 hypothetical protein SAMN05421753_116109 [Planctomicrobium piriforme]